MASPGNARKSAVLAGLAAGAGTEVVSDYLRLAPGQKVTLNNVTNDNAAVVKRIVFAGGAMTGTSFKGRPLCTANGARWRLEGEGGADIVVGPLGMQRIHWHTGDGFVETRGDCDVVLCDSDYNAASDYRGTVWLDDARTAWDHTGDLVLSNTVKVICLADNCLPHGEGTGAVRMKWVSRRIPPPLLDLNGHAVAVNGIRADGGGILTNSSAARATIVIGENDMTGMVSGSTAVPFLCANIDIEKTGAGHCYLDGKGAAEFGDLRVKSGTFTVRDTAGTESVVSIDSLQVASGAKLIVKDTTLHAASYAPGGTVEKQGTGQFLYDKLIVEEGSPLTLDTAETCAAVLLRDTLTIAAGGSLAAGTAVVVDGPAGGIAREGGSLPSSIRLSLAPDLETAAEFATVLELRTGATTLQCATNANPAVAARILFDGGILKCNSFSGKPLCSANGGKWILEGSATSPIRFGNLGLQRMDWLTGGGSVETRGPCDVVFDDSDYNVANDYRGTIWLNTSNTLWNHTGDLVLSNAVKVVCRADNCLPCGPQTGVVRMKWVNRKIPAPVLDLNGHSVAVNGIDTIAGGIVTNSARTAAAIRVGECGASGAVALPPLSGGNIGLVKRGAATNTVSLGSSEIAGLHVEEGTLVVTGSSSNVVAASVSVAQGARLIVDGVTLTTSALDDAGAIERVRGGDINLIEVRPSWFSASSVPDAANGGAWLSKPAIANGAFAVRSGAVALFAANEGRIDAPRVEATIQQDDGWPADMLDNLLAEAVARGARARIVAAVEDDGETLSWRGLVLEDGAPAWKTLLGAPVVTDAPCRVAAEFDFSGATPLVSYLAGGGASSPSEPLSRLHDANGATWFPAAGSGAGLAGRVEVSGCGDLYDLAGSAASDDQPPPPSPPSPVTIFFIQ